MFGVITLSNKLNDFIDIHDGDQQTINKVKTFLALGQAVLRTALDNLFAVFDIHREHFSKTHGLWAAVDECHIVDAEGIFEGGVAIQLFKNSFGIKPRFDFNNQFQAVMAISQVNNVGDAVEFLTGNAILNFVDDFFRANKVRKLSDSDSHLAWGNAADGHAGTGLEAATTRFVCLTDTVQAHDDTTRRKIGAGNESHQVIQRCLGVTEQVDRSLNDLNEVVRSHIGGHTDGNTAGTVDKKVGIRRR